MDTRSHRKVASCFITPFSTLEIPTGKKSISKAFSVYLSWRQSHRAYIFRRIGRAINLIKYLTTHKDPYTLIGDVGSTQKTYRNIKKLLDLIGIKYTELGTKS